MFKPVMVFFNKLFQKLILVLIAVYRYIISPWIGPCCRFEPSCSKYAEEAIRYHGFLKGFLLTLKRLFKCHPGHPGGYDPLPK
jgi:putative membrane protein insertion efficiency factor